MLNDIYVNISREFLNPGHRFLNSFRIHKSIYRFELHISEKSYIRTTVLSKTAALIKFPLNSDLSEC